MEASNASPGRWRPLKDYVLGLLLGALGVALFWMLYPGFWKEPPDAELAAAIERRAALQAQARARETSPASATVVRATAVPGACAFEPLMTPASAADGQLRAEHPFPAGPAARSKVFLRKAQRAEAAGRPRDAEVALIAACRYREQASAKPNVPLARVLGMLGSHYLAAAAQAAPEMREQMLLRARDVLERSATTYAKALGPGARHSREARQRVVALDEAMAAVADGIEPAGRMPTGDGAAQVKEPPRQKPTVAVAHVSPQRGSSSLPASTAREHAPAPPERMPEPQTSDPELRQMAADLARLRAQAEAVSNDPAGFRRRALRAEGQRARCADAPCLRAWYARRRAELLAEF